MIGVPLEDIKRGEFFKDGRTGAVYEMLDFDGWIASVRNCSTTQEETIFNDGRVYYLVDPDSVQKGSQDTLEVFPPQTCSSCDGKGRYCDFKAVGWPIVECKDCDGTGII